jgi:hypothetical protein
MSKPRYRDDDDEIDKTVDVTVPDDAGRIVEIETPYQQSRPRVAMERLLALLFLLFAAAKRRRASYGCSIEYRQIGVYTGFSRAPRSPICRSHSQPSSSWSSTQDRKCPWPRNSAQVLAPADEVIDGAM